MLGDHITAFTGISNSRCRLSGLAFLLGDFGEVYHQLEYIPSASEYEDANHHPRHSLELDGRTS
jgi:hypothetical protein